MASQRKPRCSSNEYLAIEREAELKSEYFDGFVVAMAGASESHALIVTNLVGELRNQLRDRDCRIFANDMRVDVREHGLFAYPDVAVVCGPPLFSGERRDNLRNPLLIVEVLSPSTEAYDRGLKFIKYRRIETLQEYILVAQDEARVERYLRQPEGKWLMSEATTLDGIIRLSVGGELKLAEVYAKVQFVDRRPQVHEAV
jgi:Uma2 family endonuclease